MTYIKVEKVSKKIKNNYVLKDINFEIPRGTITGFVGENGSGKTMLFRAILGFIKTNGKIEINNEQVIFNKNLPVNVGAIIETPGFIDNYTGLKNLEYLAAIKKIVGKAEILAAMSIFGMERYQDVKVKQYSLGMRQKLAIIQSYMEDQELLVLDEPTNGLDEKAVESFKQKMKDLANQNKTILIATHDKDVINEIADDIYQIKLGELQKL